VCVCVHTFYMHAPIRHSEKGHLFVHINCHSMKGAAVRGPMSYNVADDITVALTHYGIVVLCYKTIAAWSSMPLLSSMPSLRHPSPVEISTPAIRRVRWTPDLPTRTGTASNRPTCGPTLSTPLQYPTRLLGTDADAMPGWVGRSFGSVVRLGSGYWQVSNLATTTSTLSADVCTF